MEIHGCGRGRVCAVPLGKNESFMAVEVDRMVGEAVGVVVEDPVGPLIWSGKRVDVVVCGKDGFVVGDAEIGWIGPVQIKGGVVNCPE